MNELPVNRAEAHGAAGRTESVSPRLHVAIGPECNNNCLFCMEDDRASRRAVAGALQPEQVRGILEAGRDAEEVCFTSGEPTLVDDLPTYVGWARELGCRRISVTTNGRRLAYANYCDELVRAGVNRFYVSIHGHTAALHDALVRTPGAFEQTTAGIRNVGQSRGQGVELHTATVVTLKNLPHFAEIYTFMRDLRATQVVFNVLQPNGRAHTHFERLVPRYADICASFAAFLDGLAENQAPTFLVDVPRCVSLRLPAFHRGWVESYVHHEVSELSDAGPLPDSPSSFAGTDDSLVERSRAAYDAELRSKRGECAQCRYDSQCPGVWNNYLDRNGWAEFEPVLTAEAGDSKERRS